jgi:hypothetical protein
MRSAAMKKMGLGLITLALGLWVWGIRAVRRIKAVMGMAIGGPAITFGADLGKVTQPTLLVSGSLDINTPPSVSQAETNVPRAHLTAAELRPTISAMAIAFFEDVIGRPRSRWHHSQDDIPSDWLIQHHSNRSRAEEYWEADDRCHADNEC